VIRLRELSWLAILLVSRSPTPSDDDSNAFLTAPQALHRMVPSDPPAVALSGDGRYIAFTSEARLTPADTNDYGDVYVIDRITREVTLETSPAAGNLGYESPRLSGDGRLLLYERNGRTNEINDPTMRVLVVRDRSSGTSRTIEPANGPANGPCRGGTISADGRTVVFTSSATNLVADPDANGLVEDVYRYDVPSGTFSRVSLDQAGRQLSVGASFAPSVSADGRYVAFSSTARLDGSTTVSRGARPAVNLYVRDLTASVTKRVSARPDGAPPNGSSYDGAISGDGRYVAFVSDATDLVKKDGNRAPDVFLFDTGTRTTVLVSRSEADGSANGTSRHPAISAAGTVVSFQSDASDLTCSRRCAPETRDINLVADIFVFDVRTRVVSRISTGRRSWKEPSIGPSVDGSGTIIAFSSRHPRESRDDGDDYDLFVRLPVK
jgi:Tol biopolymer transport system component